MKLIHKSYKFRIYPNKPEEVLLAKHFGSCRFVFNRFLTERIEAYSSEAKISLNYYDNAKSLTNLKQDENFNFLKEVNSQSLQQSLKCLDIAYKNLFKNKTTFPRFKRKTDKQSFSIPQNTTISKDILYIPKFKDGIKVNIHRKIEGKICYSTVSKTPTGKYFISLTCEVMYKPYVKTGSVVGIDTGIKDLAVLSDGKVYENIKILRRSIKKLKFKQRKLSRKVRGGKSRFKQKLVVAKCYEKVANIRYDYLQKVTTDIVKNHDIICIENISVNNIKKNRKLAQSISDVGLGIFYQMLEYKSNWNNKTISMVDRFFPSSKLCHHCGWKNEELKLSDRTWICPYCGRELDRDGNASQNIKIEGLSILKTCVSRTDSQNKQKRAEALPLGESLKFEASNHLGRCSSHL